MSTTTIDAGPCSPAKRQDQPISVQARADSVGLPSGAVPEGALTLEASDPWTETIGPRSASAVNDRRRRLLRNPWSGQGGVRMEWLGKLDLLGMGGGAA